jgi:hypothetical protein
MPGRAAALERREIRAGRADRGLFGVDADTVAA